MTEQDPPKTAELVLQAPAVDPIDRLDDFERAALVQYRGEPGRHFELAPTLAAQLYELYLSGASCEDLSKVNQGISIGQVLEARLRYGWDDQKDRYIRDLMLHAKPRVQQVQLESLEFLRTMLAVVHRAFGKKAQKFLQSGNVKDIPDLSKLGISWKQYKEQLEMLLKLTGTAQPERKELSGTVTHEHVVKQAEDQTAAPLVRVMTPAAAASALEALENSRKAKS